MDGYNKQRDRIFQLFQELDSDDESEVDPFSDDGEYGNDPDYVPEKEREAGQSSGEELIRKMDLIAAHPELRELNIVKIK